MNDLTYIICGKLYDGVKAEFQQNMAILINGKVIEKVAPKDQLPCPESAKVIDLSASTVTPGMIDAHMHMDYLDWHNIRGEVYTTSEEMKTIAVLHTANESLKRGFTTVRHTGGINMTGFGVLDAKRAIAQGIMPGARIVAAARTLGTAGSHGDNSQAFSQNPELSRLAQSMKRGLGTGKDFFVNAVREEIKYGSDFIKIMATGGFFTPNDTPTQQQLNDEELKAIMDTAHEWGSTVTAHVYTPAHMKKLMSFGIDGMEHCSLMDEETAAMIADKGIYVVPTFCPYEEAVHYDPIAIKDKQPEFRRKLEMYKDALQAGREVIKNSKCMLGYGTDFVANHQNYESGYEYKAWMESGMGGFRALEAATRTNAKILGLADQIGTIEAGKLADISAWNRDLLTDAYALLDCAFVMKEGVVYQTVCCDGIPAAGPCSK